MREPSVGLGGDGGSDPGLGGGVTSGGGGPGLGGGNAGTVGDGGAGLGGGGLEDECAVAGQESSLLVTTVQPDRGELEGDDSPRAPAGAGSLVPTAEAAQSCTTVGPDGGDQPQVHDQSIAASASEELGPAPAVAASVASYILSRCCRRHSTELEP